MAGKKDGWSKLAKTLNAVLDETRINAFHGTVSLPFKPGKYRRWRLRSSTIGGIESLVVQVLA
jgi:adenine-specific DNA-methyltransferase